MQDAAAVGVNPDADVMRSFGVAHLHAIAFARRIALGDQRPVEELRVRAVERAHTGERRERVGVDDRRLDAELLALHADEEVSALVRLLDPGVANVTHGPVAHDGKPGKRSSV